MKAGAKLTKAAASYLDRADVIVAIAVHLDDGSTDDLLHIHLNILFSGYNVKDLFYIELLLWVNGSGSRIDR